MASKLLVASVALSGLASMAGAETVHGVVVFSRHGDRTTKWYGNQQLTSLGAKQNFQVGSAYRERYLSSDSDHQILGISENEYVKSQVYASAPNQVILSNTATAFLQGLYPPLMDTDPELASTTLNNDTEITGPLDGYQYVLLNGVGDESADTIWIKGDDDCPARKDASKDFQASAEFKARTEETKDFYEGFFDILSEGVYDLTKEDMTYGKAYDIFDLVNVARIHNETSAAQNVSDSDLLQLRTLADSSESGLYYNESQPARSIGAETLAGVILAQLNQTVSSEGALKFSLLAGSYDTFLSFFGVAKLLEVSDEFNGLPDYASTMAWELYSSSDSDSFPSNPDSDLRVRFLFRNGTEGELTNYPLFGSGEDSLSWSDFKDEVNDIAISDVGTWCETCSATMDFCAAYTGGEASSSNEGGSDSGSGKSKGGMSNAVAGVIGAVVALAVAGLVAGIAFFVVRKRKGSKAQAGPAAEKGSTRSGSTDVGNV